MSAGSPRARRCARALNFTYNHVEAVQFLRTTYKAGAAGGARPGVPRRRGVRPSWRSGCARRRVGRWPARAPSPARCWSRLPRWPLVTGDALDPQLTGSGSPPRGRAARGPRPRRCRATSAPSCCPGQRSRSTAGAARSTRSCRRSPTGRWRCATRRRTPTCTRSTCCGPWTASSSSSAPVPGQLPPLLELMSVRGRGDGQRRRHRAQRRDAAAEAPRRRCAGQGSASRPRVRAARLPPGADARPEVTLPEVRRYDVPAARGHRARGAARRRRPSWTARPRRSPGWRRSARCRRAAPSLYAGDRDAGEIRALRPRAPRSW